MTPCCSLALCSAFHLLFASFCKPQLDRSALLANLHRAHRGAAPGPSGDTAEILRSVLDEENASQLLFEVVSLLARAAVADLALGRLVALSKRGGATRGLVIGDFLLRLVARTIA